MSVGFLQKKSLCKPHEGTVRQNLIELPSAAPNHVRAPIGLVPLRVLSFRHGGARCQVLRHGFGAVGAVHSTVPQDERCQRVTCPAQLDCSGPHVRLPTGQLTERRVVAFPANNLLVRDHHAVELTIGGLDLDQAAPALSCGITSPVPTS